MTATLRETAILTRRTLRHLTRSPDTIITSALIPVALMLMFIYVFGGALAPSLPTASYLEYMLPGILLFTVGSGIVYTSVRLFSDLQGGLAERFASLPISRAAPLWAHALTSLVGTLVPVGLVLLIAVGLGFRSPAGVGSWLAALGLLAALVLALTWVAILAGLGAKTVESASAFSYPILFLPFVSSAFVPTDTMPGPLRWFAEHQPVTALVDALRQLWAGEGAGSDLWVSLAWCAGILVVAQTWAVVRYRRRLH
ncbi:ABC transporter permease [Scrofimicrobium sp. R131]|uniref:Transport permease protein n=1 Tax=Scrofimicrobium appendicitidis TaxID=3079930 RepID=A0AAU7V5N3_9ACTO